ncbi:hypothetical protein SISNIDRAFT_453422 [Sistotremastrum niveocremeum HHB9708]|uniref:histidine kinase n=2 Tax=Sistotremastraceae TaxID=3402574 RepID=A0A164VV34_9AGAM|nr:hypothetical protein SISNIDRAFT_453422 [Sistotremastrum niveocremeum HHB9708]KZT43162.1 hypothetical protein SISSUDRAFT_1040607 [Sistotremastrum suecicum HHB10207 ss-3]
MRLWWKPRSRSLTPTDSEVTKLEYLQRRSHFQPYNVTPDLPPPALISSSRRRRSKSIRIQTRPLKVHWEEFVKRLGAGSALSESNLDISPDPEGSQPQSIFKSGPPTIDHDEDPRVVEQLVVDNTFAHYHGEKSVTASDHGNSPEKSGGSHQIGPITENADSIFGHDGFWSTFPPWIFFRYRLVPTVHTFFQPRYHEADAERAYRREIWYQSKTLAIYSSLFFVLNWLLGIALVAKPFALADKIFYYGIAPCLTVPLPFMVIYDWPVDRRLFYQPFLGISAWSWSIYQLLFVYLCGLYGSHSHFPCGNNDFLDLFYYTTAMQTISLFGLKSDRFTALLSSITFFILMCTLELPVRHSWIRTSLNFAAFQLFILYLHYGREMSERRLHSLRMQLKMQYIATQKAQIAERKAADSKRRLTSYIFHEVRVPLNTALLAVQNMEASGILKKGEHIESAALEGSLNMMSKVLNDVLDFNRMDTGRFESVHKPYHFHQVMRSMILPLRLAAESKGLTLSVDLDCRVDEVARRAYYKAQGLSEEDIRNMMDCYPDEPGVVVGDEMRFRQLVTNLSSNACKFTPAGGSVHVSTKLLLPEHHDRRKSFDHPESPTHDSKPEGRRPSLSSRHLSFHNSALDDSLEFLVVRIEVTDTGLGIKPNDLIENKLFSPYVQTEIGRSQGGKGTGLGLALVRHIVSLSKGRLGVSSQLGKGSTFWVELALGIGKKALGNDSTSGIPSPMLGSHGGLNQDRMAVVFENNRGHSMAGEMMTPATEFGVSMAASEYISSRDAGAAYLASLPQPPAPLGTILETGSPLKTGVDLSNGNSPTDREASPGSSDIAEEAEGSCSTNEIDVPSSEHRATEETDTIGPSSTLGGTNVPSVFSKRSRSAAQICRPSYVELPPRPSFSGMYSTPSSPAGSSIFHTPAISAYGHGHSSSEFSLSFDRPLVVLCVDDDALTRTLMKKMLTRLGCSVLTAQDGQMALDILLGQALPTPQELPDTPNSGSTLQTQPKIDLVFLDNQMPVLSGLDVVRRLRAMGRDDFVVGVTGNALLGDVAEYKTAGADHVLTKPVLEKSLRSMLYLADERRKNLTPPEFPPEVRSP